MTMRMAVASLAAVLALAGCGGAGGDDDDGSKEVVPEEQSGRLLYFGPHPDDEYYAAPLLGHRCRDGDWSCTLVVATRGEGGGCGLPEGCDPDLASVRAAEMQASAALLGAELIHWDLGDNGRYEPYAGDVEEVLQLWASRVGGVEALLAMVTDVIRDTQPTVIYTMDWRHGNYCHPTHRAIGALVGQAVLDLGDEAPETRLLTAAWFSEMGAFGFRPVVDGDPTLEAFDATARSDALGSQSWLYVLRVLESHPSQFDLPPELTDELFLATPDANKRIWWVPMDGVVADDPSYQGLCAPSTF